MDLDLDLLIVLRYDLLLRLPGSPVAALAISCMLTVPKKKMYSKKKAKRRMQMYVEKYRIKNVYVSITLFWACELEDICLQRRR